MDQASDPSYPGYPPEPAPAELGPDDLEYRNAPGTRVFHHARQRRTDATAWGTLALHIPGFLLSLAVVLLTALLLEVWLGLPVWVPTTLWITSGALVFHRPSERFLARHLLRLQRPLPEELARLHPVWREVTARAGIDGTRYELWIEDSDGINASAAAGHIVGVTRHAVERLPTAQLAAVLAHELGHHTGGHAWSGLLGWWYEQPGRHMWRALNVLAIRLYRSVSMSSYMAGALLVGLVAWLAFVTVSETYGLPLLLPALPYLTAAVARRAELRADEHAAVLGFAPMLAQVLHGWIAEERPATGRATLPGGAAVATAAAEPGFLARLLSSHPDHRTRLHHLQPYLAGQGVTPQGGHPLG
ncbi:M48 family metalloprotease [Streptomyces sp. APSN-46.1]|uniref:M48 family metalloprotease n=1 Tax=Streptomyces sp. APSN-46.1 TaxID=2929049 RepID=UPI001FB41413|nr:M48 family metalloprotease [Streptomyces sp. APSN-46.1]MCJ1679379.1 M48 family metalloprotease [Streptomyces sp. APSN-46.1]